MTQAEYDSYMQRLRPGAADQPAKSARARRLFGSKTEALFWRAWVEPALRAGYYKAAFPNALTLDFGDGTSYRPDVFAIRKDGTLVLIEVKGGHVGKVAWSRHGIERFRRARDKWGSLFDFQMRRRNKIMGWVRAWWEE
jgi:hypothetical protein